MARTKLSSKGQIVVPKAIRERLAWPMGAELDVDTRGGEMVVRLHTDVPRTTIAEVAGSLHYSGPPVSLADMEAAIDEAMQERWERKR